jgi:ABC-2 type transport system permease protein
MRHFWDLYYADLVRLLAFAKRYFLQTFTDILAFYLIFVGLYFSIRSIAAQASPTELGTLAASQVVGYMAFYFAAMALSVIENQLQEEIHQGTLEQLLISPYSLTMILFSKFLSSFTVDLLEAFPLFALLIASTGAHIHFTLPMALVFVLLIGGVYGLALILGGLTLVFKRIGQLPFIFQVLFLGLGVSEISHMPKAVQVIGIAFPFTKGVSMLKKFATGEGFSFWGSRDFSYLLGNTFFYIVIGMSFLKWAEQIAKDRGLLGRY